MKSELVFYYEGRADLVLNEEDSKNDLFYSKPPRYSKFLNEKVLVIERAVREQFSRSSEFGKFEITTFEIIFKDGSLEWECVIGVLGLTALIADNISFVNYIRAGILNAIRFITRQRTNVELRNIESTISYTQKQAKNVDKHSSRTTNNYYDSKNQSLLTLLIISLTINTLSLGILITLVFFSALHQ